MTESPDRAPSVAPVSVGMPTHVSLMLAVVAGLTDLTGFLTLGHVFTAHVTGNIALLAADLIREDTLKLQQLIVAPVFVAAVCLALVLARWCRSSGFSALRALLWMQFGLLTLAAIVATLSTASSLQIGAVAATTAFAVIAIACQFAIAQVVQPGSAATATMTVNVTNTVLLLFELHDTDGREAVELRRRLRKSASMVLGFFCGCLIAAMTVKECGYRAWWLPALLAGALAFLCQRDPRTAH